MNTLQDSLAAVAPHQIVLWYPGMNQKSRPVPPIMFQDGELMKLAEGMLATLQKHGGLGLAAVQIGVLLQVAVIWDARPRSDGGEGWERVGDPVWLVNAVLKGTEGPEVEAWEGCLSLPGIRAKIKRPSRVFVQYQDLQGNTCGLKAEDMLARAVLHETDHWQGKFYWDHLSALKRDLLKSKFRAQIKRQMLQQQLEKELE